MARVDEFMAWQHFGLRLPITRYIIALLKPEKLGLVTKPGPDDIANYKKLMEVALDNMEKIWLAETKFIHGDQMSIADLLAIGEIEMTSA